jgi:A/G-specific adenine glycosylase
LSLRFHFDPKPAARRLVTWYRQQARPLPWRVLFKEHGDAYHIWVSEIMLQQTVIKAVIPAYERFLKAYPTVRHLAAADEESLRLVVRGLGYYRRFDFLLKAARVVQQDFGGRLPVTYDEWRMLPGIGDYTAAAISSIAFGEKAAVVDGNVERVFCRLLDIRQPPNLPVLKKEFQRLAREFLYERDPGSFNQGIMELGQTVCTVTQPDCGSCPLAESCLARQHSTQHLAPAPKIKKAYEELAMRLHILRYRGRIGLVRRPAGAKFLGGTRGFCTEVSQGDNYHWDGALKLRTGKQTRAGAVRHTITHHKISAEVLLHDVTRDATADIQWLDPDVVDENLVSNLDRKAWRLVQNSGI